MKNLLRNFKKIPTKIGDGIHKIVEKFDSEDPLMIVPFRGYATEERLYLKGRILEDENIFGGKTESQIRTIINNFKRFETDEVPDAQVLIQCYGQSFECKTDEEGYFVLDTTWEAPKKDKEQHWIPVQLELLYPVKPDDSRITAMGEVYFPATNTDYGVITDIDDTILQTHVTSLLQLKMLYTTFFKNAYQRKPMEGMVELFQKFAKGGSGTKQNPIFYLSHSPWNIYDLLVDFLEVQEFPKGPILLRDYGRKPSGEYHNHKMTRIDHILHLYPDLPFVLLGDSADEDADFYIETAKNFPDRIKAIYIRQTKNTKNAKRIKKLIEESTHVEAILVHDSTEINAHAAEIGLLQQLAD